jgi:hypothetical protein
MLQPFAVTIHCFVSICDLTVSWLCCLSLMLIMTKSFFCCKSLQNLMVKNEIHIWLILVSCVSAEHFQNCLNKNKVIADLKQGLCDFWWGNSLYLIHGNI